MSTQTTTPKEVWTSEAQYNALRNFTAYEGKLLGYVKYPTMQVLKREGWVEKPADGEGWMVSELGFDALIAYAIEIGEPTPVIDLFAAMQNHLHPNNGNQYDVPPIKVENKDQS